MGTARMPRGLPQVGSSSQVSRERNNRNRWLVQDSACAPPSVFKHLYSIENKKDHSSGDRPCHSVFCSNAYSLQGARCGGLYCRVPAVQCLLQGAHSRCAYHGMLIPGCLLQGAYSRILIVGILTAGRLL